MQSNSLPDMTAPDWRPTPLLVLDLDGTVREGKDDALGKFVNGPEDVHVFPQAITRMQQWKADNAGRILGLTNQGGIAMGFVTLKRVTEAVMETQRQTGMLFDTVVICKHHPQAREPWMTHCWCRKPAPGGLIEGALALANKYKEMYPPNIALFVGDRPEDEECAARVNIPFMWAQDWRERGYYPNNNWGKPDA